MPVSSLSPFRFHLIFAAIALFASPWSLRVYGQRDLRDIPKPDPIAERNAMVVDDSIEVQLFAADPMFAKPIHSNFDPLGRLWVASSSVYPQIAPGEKADDKIVILEDVDQDGIADKSTLFADGLLIPTGVLPDVDGRSAYVAASTQLLYLRDTDGDGKADQTRIVLSGFGTEDTHHLLHTLRWGPDGWLYMNQSIYIHSHIETPYGTRHLDGGGIWRYHPATKRLEIVCKGFVNPWGHVFDTYGQHFATDGAYGEGINPVFPGAVFVTSPGAERWLSGLNPGSPKHCSLEVLTGNHIPTDLFGQYITNDFRSHRVCRFQVSRTTNGYLSRQQPELIRTEHVAFRPIDCKVGADGALYIADWYNPIIQHGEVDFRDDRRDRTHGRIWRITWKNRPLHKNQFKLGQSIENNVKLLDDTLDLTRQWARLALQKEPSEKVLAAMQRWYDEGKQDRSPYANTTFAIGDIRKLERLRMSEVCSVWDRSFAEELFTDPHPQLRAIAIQMASWNLEQWTHPISWLSRTIDDEDWQVRLASVVALRRLGSPEAMNTALRALRRPMHPSIDFALWSFVRETEGEWSQNLDESRSPWIRDLPSLLFVAKGAKEQVFRDWLLERIGTFQLESSQSLPIIETLSSTATANQSQALLDWLSERLEAKKLSGDEAAELLDRILDGTSARNIRPERAEQSIRTMWTSHQGKSPTSSLKLQKSLARAIALWSIESQLDDVWGWLLRTIELGEAKDMEVVVESFGGMKIPKAKEYLQSLALDPKKPASLRGASISGISKQDLGLAAKLCIDGLSTLPTGMVASMGISSLASRKNGPEALIQELASSRGISPDTARAAIEAIQSNSISRNDLIDALRIAGKLSDHRWIPSKELTQELIHLSQTQGDPTRGEMIYRMASLQCSRCHPIGTAGGQIGPNLVSLGGSSQVDYIVESILDPQAKLKEGFQTIVCLTEDGEVISGLERSRTPNKLSLLTSEGKVLEIDRSSIAEEKTGKSLMPAGLVDILSRQQLADLVRFLSELGRTPEWTVKSDLWIRRWETLAFSEASQRILNRTSLDSVAVENPTWEWNPMVSKINGLVPLDGLARFQPHRDMKPVVVLRTRFNVKRAGTLAMEVKGSNRRFFWLNGKPLDLDSTQGSHFFAEGKQTVAVVVEPLSDQEIGIRLNASGETPAIVDLDSE